MSLRLGQSRSAHAISFYVISDTRDPITKRRSTTTVERLGTLKDWMAKLDAENEEEVISHLHSLVADREKKRKEGIQPVAITFDPAKDIPLNDPLLYNAGYLYPMKVLSMLKIQEICSSLSDKYKFQYKPGDILCDVICAFILHFGSGRAVFEKMQHFLHPAS